MKKKQSVKPIVLFYHLFATNDWKNICAEQFASLQHAGLSQVAKVHVCISGPEKSCAYAFLKKLDIDFMHCEFHIFEENLYEWSTLQLLWDMAQNDDAYYLYFHAKGVTQTGERRIHINSWRQYLNYFCMTRWKDCVDFLENGVDMAGCQYLLQTPYFPCHYAGNFWWATSYHIQKLTNPVTVFENRLEAEFWPCRIPHQAANLWSTKLDMYRKTILPESYQNMALEPIVYKVSIERSG